jgi:hypothetical protein
MAYVRLESSKNWLSTAIAKMPIIDVTIIAGTAS